MTVQKPTLNTYFLRNHHSKVFVILLAITILAFFLRFYKLGDASFLHDEICTIERVTETGSPNPIFPPLYYDMLFLWTKLVGMSEFTLRFPSALFSTLSIPSIFILARRLYDDRTGLIAAFFLSISTISIDFGRYAKMYALFWFLTIIAFDYFIKTQKTNEKLDSVLFIFFSTLMIYVYYVGLIILSVQTLIMVFFFRKNLKRYALMLLVIFLLFIPQIGPLYNAVSKRPGLLWIKPATDDLGLVQKILFETSIGKSAEVKPEGILYFMLILLIFVRGFSKTNDLILVSWVIIPVIVGLVVNKLFFPFISQDSVRYIGFIHIPLTILVGRAISIQKKFSLILLILLSFLIISNYIYPQFTPNDGIIKSAHIQFIYPFTS